MSPTLPNSTDMRRLTESIRRRIELLDASGSSYLRQLVILILEVASFGHRCMLYSTLLMSVTLRSDEELLPLYLCCYLVGCSVIKVWLA